MRISLVVLLGALVCAACQGTIHSGAETCAQGVVPERGCSCGASVVTSGYCCSGAPSSAPCASPEDADGDGYDSNTDCDDGDAAIYPGAPEICGDGVDQDCQAGDAVCPTCAQGVIAARCACGGEAHDSGSCCADAWQAGACSACPDADQDLHPDATCGGDDCDDTRPTVHPGAPEICGDGVDQDCQGGDLLCACDQGAIAAPCLCGGSAQASGYCCSGAWQAGECPVQGPDYQLPASRVTRWEPGVRGGIPDCATVQVTLDAPAGDMTQALQDALDAAGTAAGPGACRVVLLGAGVFTISNTLRVPSYVVLRGAGLDAAGDFKTQIRSDGPGFTLVLIGDDSPGEALSVDLAADAVKGTSSVRLLGDAAAAGFAAGQLVLLDELTDGVVSQWASDFPADGRGWYSRLDRPIAELLEVAAVDGDTVSFETPSHIAIRTAQGAQLTRYGPPPTRLAGVEELRLTTGYNGSGNYGYDQACLMLGFAVDCWARHFEADGSAGKSVGLRLAHRCEARQGYLHDTQYYQNGGWGYGFDVTHGSSDNLIEDNISIRFNKVINFRGAGGGNVVGYNYMDDGAISWQPDWIETGLQASHYPTPHFELFEGNYSFNADGDNTSGNAVYITFFRSHLSGQRAQTRRPSPNTYGDEDPVLVDTGNVRCAGAMSGHKWYNFVGNVLGRPGMSGMVYEAEPPDMLAAAVWRSGSFSDWSTQDPEVPGTMIRDGNYDYLTDSVHWHGLGGAGSDPATLPDSLYLAGKPAFFGANRWPWVDPLGATKTYTLPAKARYDAGAPNVPLVAGQQGPAPMPVISRGVPVYSSGNLYADGRPLSSVNDADYAQGVRSQGYPFWVAYDLNGVPPAQRGPVLLAWYNESYGYATSEDGSPTPTSVSYNEIGDYELEAAAGGPGSVPAAWTSLVTVAGNRNHSRTHLLDLTGYTWVRLRATAGNPDNSAGNQDAELQLDLHDARLGNTDSWAFLGDSITAGGMGHDPGGGQNFAERVAAATGSFPAYENAGIGFDTAIGQGLGRLTYLLEHSAARYIGLAYGTNDGAGNPASDYAFYDAYAAMVDAVLADGRIPVIPTIPYSNDPAHNDAIGDPARWNGGDPLPADLYLLNVQLEKLKADYRAQGETVLDGPDLWAYFCQHPEEIEAGYVHPTAAGYLVYRNLWADALVASLYAVP